MGARHGCPSSSPFAAALPLAYMSIGDIAVACRLALLEKGFVEGVPMEIFDDYPLLVALCEHVEAEPRSVAYKENLTKK